MFRVWGSIAAEETKERMQPEAETRAKMLKKDFEGERNVLTTRVDSMEATIKEQSQRIAKLSQQLEKSYQQVQDIAVKSVESAVGAQSLSGLQQLLKETVEKKES